MRLEDDTVAWLLGAGLLLWVAAHLAERLATGIGWLLARWLGSPPKPAALSATTDGTAVVRRPFTRAEGSERLLGKVVFRNEIWHAEWTGPDPLPAVGERVRIVGVRGLTIAAARLDPEVREAAR